MRLTKPRVLRCTGEALAGGRGDTEVDQADFYKECWNESFKSVAGCHQCGDSCGGGVSTEAFAQTTLGAYTVTGSSPGTFGGTGGGGGGGYGGTQTDVLPDNSYTEDPQCPTLRTSKPSGCTDDVPVPGGAEFGAERFQFGSALDRAIVFTNNHLADASVAAKARQALANHTASIAQLTVPASAANDTLMRSVAEACNLESQILDGFPQISPRPWQIEKDCANVVGQLVAESGIPFLPWFADWIETRTGFTLSDAQHTFVNWLSPANSLHTKFELTTGAATCSAWWKEVKARGC